MENVNEFVTDAVMENAIEGVVEKTMDEAVKHTSKRGFGKRAKKFTIGTGIATLVVGAFYGGYKLVKKHNAKKKAKNKADEKVIDAEHEIVETVVIKEEN